MLPATAEILVEVTSLDAVRERAKRLAHGILGRYRSCTSASLPTEETHWKSRSSRWNPFPEFPFSSGNGNDVQRGKPIAVEGDLSAVGMRFCHRRRPLERRHHRPAAAGRTRRPSTQRRQKVGYSKSSEFPARGKSPPLLAPLPRKSRWTPSSPSAACCAAKRLTTKPSTTKSLAASVSLSRRRAVPHAFGVLDLRDAGAGPEPRRSQGRQQGL